MRRTLSLFLILFLLTALLSSCAKAPSPEPEPPGEPEVPAAVASPAPSPQPADDTEYRVSFFATGDNLIHTGIWRQANRNTGGSGDDCRMDSDYDFAPFYASLKGMIEKADIAFLNQETLVAADEEGLPSNYPAFNTPRACGDTMVALGFDVANIANNHMLDMGASGLKNSIEYWRTKENVTQIGAYLDREDYDRVRVVEKNGVKVAFLAYAEDPNNSNLGTQVPLSNYQPYSDLGLYVPALNEAELTRQVKAAKEEADFVVVAMHWGVENSEEISGVQEHYAALCASLGVDVILGSHPHVIQKMEWLPAETPSGKTLAVYSLGNMISLMEGEGNMLGGALTFDFVKKGAQTHIENAVFTPTVSHCDMSYRDIRVCLLKDYSEADYSRHYIHRYCETDLGDFSRIMRTQIPEEFWGDASY